MSPKRDKTVPELVEKYRQQFPNLERPLLRKLIRIENEIENPSELKKLDRHLKKAFKSEVNLPTEKRASKPSAKKPSVKPLSLEQRMDEVNLQVYLRLLYEIYGEDAISCKKWADVRKQQLKELGLI